MSLPDRRFLLAGFLALGACGFEPAFAPGGAETSIQNRIRVAKPSSADTYLLVQNLEQQLGRPADPEFDLKYSLSISVVRQAITVTGATTRLNIQGTLTYRVTEVGSNEEVTAGQVVNFTSYSARGSTIDTLAAQRDSRRRLMVILADELVTQLVATGLPE